MSETAKTGQLGAAIETLRVAGVIPAVATPLKADADAITQTLFDVVLQDTPAYTTSGNPDVLPELREHLAAHIEEVCRLLAGHPADELEFVRAHARLRAEQKFPLDALLQTYRCLHKKLSQWVRDAALQVADDDAHVRRVVAAATDFTIEYTGAIGTLITSEYVSHTRLRAEAEGDRRIELLNMLLNGYDESDSRAAQLLRRGGYLEQRQSFCVAVVRSVNPQEMENTARTRRMLQSVSEALRDVPMRSLLGVRDDLVTVVLSGTRRQSGWTTPQSLLADRVFPHLLPLGPAVLVGLSSDAPSTSHIPRALDEARLTLDFATVAERVMPYARIPFRQMLVHLAADNIQSTLPPWLDTFLAADDKSRGVLMATLQAYADADMNVLRAARELSVHPNTIYARVQKIEDITGRNVLSYHALTELLLAADCRRY